MTFLSAYWYGFSSAPIWYVWLFAVCIYGLSIGSFLNVVIYRLPRGQSVSTPTWSYCPNCKHKLGGWDLIPVLSFLMLGRKCRYCKQPISWRYCSVELLTGFLFAIIFLRDGPGMETIFDCLLVALLIPAFFIDLEHFIIPDEINVLGFALGVTKNVTYMIHGASGAWIQPSWMPFAIPGSIGSAIICALIFHLISFLGLLYYRGKSKSSVRLGKAVGGYWLGVLDDYAYLIVKFLGFGLWLAPAKNFIAVREAMLENAESDIEAPEIEKSRSEIAAEIENEEEQTGMGQGDAKLALMIGANLLLPLSILSFGLAIMSGAVIGLIVSRGRGGAAIPFGPFLAVGALATLLCGHELLAWYIHYAHLSPI